jgi:type IV secretory pathway VirB2 component (pilin)
MIRFPEGSKQLKPLIQFWLAATQDWPQINFGYVIGITDFATTFRILPCAAISLNRSFIMKKPAHLLLARVVPWLLTLGMSATLAFAQTSSFGQAAQGIATEMIAIAKWVGIILCIICGIGLMAGGPGTVAKVSGLLLGLVFALFASPIITWVQAL